MTHIATADSGELLGFAIGGAQRREGCVLVAYAQGMHDFHPAGALTLGF